MRCGPLWGVRWVCQILFRKNTCRSKWPWISSTIQITRWFRKSIFFLSLRVPLWEFSFWQTRLTPGLQYIHWQRGDKTEWVMYLRTHVCGIRCLLNIRSTRTVHTGHGWNAISVHIMHISLIKRGICCQSDCPAAFLRRNGRLTNNTTVWDTFELSMLGRLISR